MFQDVFRKVQEQETEFYKALAGKGEKKDYDRPFFNTIEYLAFLIEHEMVEERYFKEFYRDGFVHWWQLFEKHVAERVRNDPAQYQEFKKLVQRLKTCTK